MLVLIFELQFHTPKSLEVKEGALHKLYEEARTTKNKRRSQELNTLMRELCNTIPNPKNAFKINNLEM